MAKVTVTNRSKLTLSINNLFGTLEEGKTKTFVITGTQLEESRNELLALSAKSLITYSVTDDVVDDATEVVLGNDPRLEDNRTPTAHASTHSALGSDPITPASIGAATQSTVDVVTTQRGWRKTTATSVTMASGGESLFVSTALGAVTVTIPSNFTAGTVEIKKISRDANPIYLKPQSAETIEGGASYTSYLLPLSDRPAFGKWAVSAVGSDRYVSLIDMPWTPLDDPNCILWLEPNCGVTLSGNELLSWTDRTSGIVCTPTGANKWQRDTAIGGEFVGFSCLGYPLSIPIGPKLVGASALTLIVTCYDENNTASYLCEYGTNGAANAGTFAILPNFTVSDSISFFVPGSGGANQWRANTSTIDLATPRTLTFRVNYNLATNEISPIRSNGTDLAGSYITNTNSATTFTNDTLYVGARSNLGNGWLGHILDIVLLVGAAP